VGADELLTGWDDNCPGLVATKAREAIWQERQDQNDEVAANWAVEAPTGWGGCKGNPNSLREQLSLKTSQGKSKLNI
jgi:hypothetical protein